jgi:hypothetical protein
MPSLPRLHIPMTRRRWIAAAVAGTVALGGAATGATLALRGHPAAPRPTALSTPAVQAPHAGASSTPTAATPSPAPTKLPPGSLLPRTLQPEDLHATYSAIPLRFAAPSISIDVPMTGVGLTAKNAVDAPEGPASSPIWDQAFWYRGGAEPGQPGVLALAGHVDRVGGAPAAFAHLPQIKAGDVVAVTDERSGITYHYRITDARAYSLKEVGTMAVLDRIYGPDVDRAQPAHVPADGVGRISIITCTGTWQGSQYDHRFVAFGDLVDQTS